MEKSYPNELTNLRSSEMTNQQSHQNQKYDLERKSRFIQIIFSLLANASILSAGMGLGYPAVVLESLSKDEGFSDEQISWFASINAFVSPIGGILSATILDLLGRKKTLVVINFLSITSWGLIYASSKTDHNQMFWQIMLGRFLIGVMTGLSSSPAAIYSAEIASPKLRGRLASLTSLSIAIGILIVYILGFFFPNDWRLIAMISLVLCCVTLILILFIPESPSWLVSRGYVDEARLALSKIRGINQKNKTIQTTEIIDSEIEQMQNRILSGRSQSNDKPSVWKILRSNQVLKPLLIINAFFAFQQLTGTFVIVVYATKFVESTSADVDKFFITVLIGVSRVIATYILAFFILDRFGRKPPSIFSGIGMSISMLMLSVYGAFGDHLPLRNFMTIFLLLMYMISSTFGFLTIPFTMIAELFNIHVKGLAAGISISFCYFISFISIKTYPLMVDRMGSATVFLIYGIISILATGFVYIFLPETKGKTLEEIQNLFKSKSEKINSAPAMNKSDV